MKCLPRQRPCQYCDNQDGSADLKTEHVPARCLTIKQPDYHQHGDDSQVLHQQDTENVLAFLLIEFPRIAYQFYDDRCTAEAGDKT